MKNVLLCLCRKTHGLTKSQVALKLGMTEKDYKKLESGVLLMTDEQAGKLSDLYNIGPKYFLKSSRQLDLLLLRGQIIKAFTLESDVRNLLIKKLSQNIPDGITMDEIEAPDENVSDEEQTTHQ
ncbi:hypothetical protein A4D02_36085 [Niastella koreensis]|uniref:HTH cro/C1-type domain-containing protein n=3 Tax=Niastella koreensis TaxID=354356 RepID=G8TJI2_NIAKG|nr:helix-turn-helix transcriptional regulator [Niastella koreensis]AEV99717.1 hypothetical protein Niako_3412 [Niastella koreensis GR20-10]OQP40674.1 hypothetical protein A4D02_36085 [Niastella koreensis]